MRADTVVVRGAFGEVTVGTHAASNSVEAFIEDSSLISEAQGIEYGTRWLEINSETVDQIDLGLEPGTALRPWTGVAKGDALNAPNRAGDIERARVMGVGFTGLRRNGVPRWTFTLGSASQRRYVTAQQQLTQLTAGSARGTFGSASPRIAPSFADLPTTALTRNTIPVADTQYFVPADDPTITADNTPDRTNPYLFDDAQALIRVECRCESLVGSDDSVLSIWRVAYAADGTTIATDEIESFTWPGDVRRYTHVTEILFFQRQGLQFRTPEDGAGAHRLITVQPITSSPN